MKKKFFRSLSIFLAVMMMALMIPAMSASADEADWEKGTKQTVTIPTQPSEAVCDIYLIAQAVLDNGRYLYNIPNDITDLTVNSTTGYLEYQNEVLDSSNVSSLLDTLDNNDFFKSNLQKMNSTTLKAGDKIDLLPGYYLAVPTGVTVAHKTIFSVTDSSLTIPIKSADVTVDKKITNITNGAMSGTASDGSKTAEGAVDSVVNFKITTVFPSYDKEASMIRCFTITDTPGDGLSQIDIGDVTVVVLGASAALVEGTHYTIKNGESPNERGFVIDFIDKDYILANGGKTVEVRYSSTIVDGKSKTDIPTVPDYGADGVADIKNNVELKYDNKYDTSCVEEETETDEVDIFAIELKLEKKYKDATGGDVASPNPKPKFAVYGSTGAAGQEVINTSDVKVSNTSLGSDDTLSIHRLPVGVYFIRETYTPEGFKQSPDVKVTITTDKQDYEFVGDYTVCVDGGEIDGRTIKITNYAGHILPGTGGTGTVIFTVSGIGIVLLAGAMFIIYMKKRRIED